MRQKILIIDDDRDILELIEFFLEEKGFDVITSVCPDILDHVLDIMPDLILLDDWLEGTPGHELCKALKADPLTAHIPVIMFSAALGLAEIAERCSADTYIEKPFDLDILELKISSALAGL